MSRPTGKWWCRNETSRGFIPPPLEPNPRHGGRAPGLGPPEVGEGVGEGAGGEGPRGDPEGAVRAGPPGGGGGGWLNRKCDGYVGDQKSRAPKFGGGIGQMGSWGGIGFWGILFGRPVPNERLRSLLRFYALINK